MSATGKHVIRKFRRQDETKISRKDTEKARTTQRRQARQIKALEVTSVTTL